MAFGTELRNRREGFETEALQSALDRVLLSEAFSRSPQLSQFLRFVGQAAIQNPDVAFSEYDIGVAALGRPRDYSPGEDNIVRVQARTLRQKLEKYYAGEGQKEAIRIVVPRGSYVPQFVAVGEAAPVVRETADTTLTVVERVEEKKGRSLKWQWGVAFGVAILGLLVFAGSQPGDAERFWAGYLKRGGTVVLVPTDVSLVVMQELTKQTVPLAKYAGRDYWHDFVGVTPEMRELERQLGSRRLTSLTSMKAAILLTGQATRLGARVEQQYAREARADAIDHEQLFLVGAAHSNPWVDVFAAQSGFRIEYAPGAFRVRTVKPEAGEKGEYATTASSARVYGLISYLPNQRYGKDVLMVQGTGSAGTEAALDFLFNEDRMNEFLRGLGAGGGKRHFEVLLESVSVAGTAPSAKVLAKRRY